MKHKENNLKTINVDGNTAASKIAYFLSEVAEIYPITPSSAMAENCDEWASKGKKNIFGNKLMIRELQSEAGAVGALHGSLSAGALSTTFTASQGLLLMIPTMYKIAGELLPTVFHVSARALATHALSIFGDQSDIMAVRSTGFNLLCSGSVQETQDLALVAHIASLNTSLPFVHFFDGFRTSHEVQKIEEISEDDIKKIFPFEKVKQFKQRALNPLNPVQKGTAQNPDIFFQNREACNTYYAKVYDEVEKAMQLVGKVSGRFYKPFEYYGDKKAEQIIVIMGSGAQTVEETIDYLNKQGNKFGLIKVRLYRPFNAKTFCKAIPDSVKKIAVLDRTKESGAIGEPLYIDVLSALAENNKSNIKVLGGRYGLGSKEFTPDCVKEVFDNLNAKKPINGFTVGINDDVTKLSLPQTGFKLPAEKTTCLKFFGLGSDGTVSANKNSIKIIGEHTNSFIQGFFEYDSKKSGSITISHLRISENPIKSAYLVTSPDFIAIHNYSFVAKYNLIENLKQGGTVLLNTVLDQNGLSEELPANFVKILKEKNAKLFVINAQKIATECGLGNKINVIMQSAFFKITNIIDSEKVYNSIKKAIHSTYGRKGETIVNKNIIALDKGFSEIIEINVEYLKGFHYEESKQNTDKYFNDFIKPINRLEGDKLPVSAFSPDGNVPTGTTKFEKRGIALQCPEWLKDNCIQCGFCVMACPHSALRAVLVKNEDLGINSDGSSNKKNVPDTFETKDAMGMPGYQYKLQLSPLDCTGCGVCQSVCPAVNKALKMVVTTDILDKEKQNYEFTKTLQTEKAPFPTDIPKGLQFLTSYFEYNYACGGCGETPYIRLATCLFGDSMIIANATGCSSIYGGSAPACPYTKDENGCGPAWANSLFENNAEFGFGIKLGIEAQKERLKENIQQLLEIETGENSEEEKISSKNLINVELETQLKKWLEQPNNANKDALEELVGLLEKELKTNKHYEKTEIIKKIIENKDYLAKKSVWMIGGDGWAYDIGYGGLDHVLASDEDVNLLVLDTEVYSNTGGQSSKSTPKGAYAKFAASGKTTGKKDLGALAMNYPNAYVASVSMGADMIQCIKAFKEAESHKGPSLIIAYSPCTNHGFNMSNTFLEMKKAVESGYWFLYRNNPNAKIKFSLDSKEPTLNYEEFLMGESRYSSIAKQNPELAHELFKQSAEDAKVRYKKLKQRLTLTD
ncbi:MAG: pyruvate:ferredoxin (flavodoxin) oxidoreductase [Clostridia bacterium]|nr:pyruvate:ferredoxin (flavodoxin) oxidoreductase [Clostridia bacterium]